ncbi:MAG: cation transporter [Candidatus Heimdallarchaeota archaeon]|nr:cation transporter [Candidatus Heimdallarchaeota archaeon]
MIIMNEVILKVEGMTCSHCEMSVKKALKAIKGVKDVKVSYKSGLAEIVVKEGKTSPVELIEAVEAEGYKATSA